MPIIKVDRRANLELRCPDIAIFIILYRHLIYSPADNCKADTRCSPILILPPDQVVLDALRYYILFSMMWSRMWCVYYSLVNKLLCHSHIASLL